MEAKTPLRGVVYGGMASAIAEATTIPLDVLKVRMQLQGEGGKNPQYRNLRDAAVKIAQREGPTAFFKGFSPTVVRQLTYGSLRFGLYTNCRKVFGVEPGSTQPRPLRKAMAGVTAGGLAAFVCNPIDLVKVRMMAHGLRPSPEAPPPYRGILDAFAKISRQEGPLALYKGVVPTSTRAAVVAATEIAGYDEIKCAFLRKGWLREGIALHFSVAMLSGLLASAASNPFDVVKSRLMSQPFDERGVGLWYKNMTDCFTKSFRSEGCSFVFKGFWPAYLAKAPTVALLFVLYEQIRLRGDRWLDSREGGLLPVQLSQATSVH